MRIHSLSKVFLFHDISKSHFPTLRLFALKQTINLPYQIVQELNMNRNKQKTFSGAELSILHCLSDLHQSHVSFLLRTAKVMFEDLASVQGWLWLQLWNGATAETREENGHGGRFFQWHCWNWPIKDIKGQRLPSLWCKLWLSNLSSLQHNMIELPEK